jgi:hypothetical protein
MRAWANTYSQNNKIVEQSTAANRRQRPTLKANAGGDCGSATVTSKRRERHDDQKTTLTRQTISLFLDTIRPDFPDTQTDPKGFKNFSHRTF